MSIVKRRTLALALATLLAPAAWATTLLKLSDEALTRQADVIVYGQAVAVESGRFDGEIVTLVSIEPHEAWKGEAGALQVVVPGGVDLTLKHPVATVYPGAPQLLVGQDLVLFLELHPGLDGAYSIVGFSQGAFEVRTLPGADAEIRRNLSGVHLVGPGQVVRGGETALPLAAFKAHVQGLLAATAGARP